MVETKEKARFQFSSLKKWRQDAKHFEINAVLGFIVSAHVQLCFTMKVFANMMLPPCISCSMAMTMSHALYVLSALPPENHESLSCLI